MTQEEVLRWVVNAVSDGWTIKPTYSHEDMARAASLGKNDYKALTLARQDDRGGSVSVWGPDRLAIEVPFPYDWNAIVAGTKICCYCSMVGDTVRIGFAGRCCPKCREEHKAKVEYPGWCN